MWTTQNKTAPDRAAGTTRSNYNPDNCPKFLKCDAPICPPDPDWRKRVLFSEDATCFYLTESVKHGAETIFQGAGLGKLYEVIVRLTPDITARHARIRRALERAKLTGSRMTCLPPKGNQSDTRGDSGDGEI